MLRKRRLKDKGVVQVTFGLPEEAGGDVVHLVGEFTDWQGTPMKRQKDGSWRTTVELEPGRTYQFRYLVDGKRWENDWDADDYVQNPFGHDNSVVETPELESGGGRSRKGAQKKASGARKGAGRKKGATGKKDASGKKDATAGRKKAGTPARESGREDGSGTKRGATKKVKGKETDE